MLFAMNQGGRRNSNIWRARQVPNQTFAWRSYHWPIIKESVVFSFVAPSISLHSFRPLKGFLTPLQRPKPHLVGCFWNSKETRTQSGVCARRGGPRTPWRTNDSNLDCVFVFKHICFCCSNKWEGPGSSPPPIPTPFQWMTWLPELKCEILLAPPG